MRSLKYAFDVSSHIIFAINKWLHL